MPRVNLALTQKFRDQWAEHWRTRPQSVQPDVTTVLLEAVPVTDYSQFIDQPRDGAEFWLTDALPEHVILVADNASEYKVIALRRRKLKNDQPSLTTRRPPTLESRVAELEQRNAEMERQIQQLMEMVNPRNLIATLRETVRR